MSQVQEIFLIGEDFEPGIVGNSEIDILLGHDTAICGEFAIRRKMAIHTVRTIARIRI